MPISLNGTTGAITGMVSSSSSDLSTSLTAKVSTTGQTGTVNLSNATIVGAGHDLIAKQDFSNAATVSVNNCFTSTYQNYRIIVNSANTSASSYDLQMRGRTAGTDNSGTIYYDWYAYGTTAWSVGRANAQSFMRVGVTGNSVNTSTVEILAAVTIPGQISLASKSSGYDGSGMYGSVTSALTGGSISFDGFTIYSYSGNLTGTIRVYGLRNS